MRLSQLLSVVVLLSLNSVSSQSTGALTGVVGILTGISGGGSNNNVAPSPTYNAFDNQSQVCIQYNNTMQCM